MVRRILLLLLLLSPPPWSSRAVADEPPVDFNRQIRGILSDRCFTCHGPDQSQRQAELRLDVRDAAVADRGGGAAIVPGRPEQSELMSRVQNADADLRMPPADSGKQLSDHEIELLKRWIAQGAGYQQHWSFLPLRDDVAPPLLDQASAWSNSIDAFVQNELATIGATLSPPADRGTLIRRLYLDLIGLLPPPAEVQRFIDDPRPDAYEGLVDRLLSSPHYGERWGRHWLDQARYADSHGYTIDGARDMWPFRDWVIKAFNDDLPFDRFTIEQLAGDLLPSPTKHQLVATGFHRNTLINQEGGTDSEQFRIEAVMDRVATTGAVWLGLTLGCAQCHSHKFDPISHVEYYRFLAFFNHGADENNVGPTVEVHQGELFHDPTSRPLIELREAAAFADALKARRGERQKVWEEAILAQSEGKVSPRQLDWKSLVVTQAQAQKASLEILEDGSVLATRGVPREIYSIETLPLSPDTTLGSIQLRAMTHDSLPKNGPGLAGNGNFVLTAFEAYLGDERLPLAAASGSHAQVGFPVAALVDDDPGTGWAINVAPGSSKIMNDEHAAWLSFERPIVADGRALKFILRHELNNDYNLGRFHLSWSADATDASADPALLEALRTPAGDRTPQQQQTLQGAFSAGDVEYKKARGQVDALRRRAGLGPAVQTMVMAESQQRRSTHVFTRGDFLRPEKERGALEPGVLAVLPALTTHGADPVANGPPHPDESGERSLDRMDLARWLVRADNPLTPRVAVNRIWMSHFGRGLVETENDFGSQGSPPTHPALLDWLAAQFIESQWSRKAIQRLIVTSETYKQSSMARPELQAVDPLNLLLGRQNRLRLEAEIVRDAALCASGAANLAIGGPSVHPPQPDGVYAFTQNRKTWQTATGDDRFRRAIYTMFYRSAPYPMLTTFDSPDFQSTCTRRARSNTPLQALTMANDEAMYELAQGFAARILNQSNLADDAAAGVHQAFWIAFARRPGPGELASVLAFLDQQRERLGTGFAAAKSTGADAAADAKSLVENAAWTAVARAMMNTDEFITRE